MAHPDPDPDRNESRRGSGVSLQTLIIASIASAAAAYGASRIWGTGTLISAAITPVVVALVSELLRRPVQTVATSAKRIPPVHPLPVVRPPTSATPRDPTDAMQDPKQVRTDPTSPAPPPSPSTQPRRPRPRPVEPAAASTPGPVSAVPHQTAADARRPRWRLAVLTGLLAFAIVVAVYTVPDLVAGHSVTGNGQPTTFFGASAHKNTKTSPTTTVTTTTTSPTTVTTTAPATSTTTATPTTKTITTTPTSPQATSTTQSPVTPTTTSPAP